MSRNEGNPLFAIEIIWVLTSNELTILSKYYKSYISRYQIESTIFAYMDYRKYANINRGYYCF